MPRYYDFEISLAGVEPKIWRRLQIRSTATFLDLHDAIQAACGWENDHLFAFRTKGRRNVAGLALDESEPDAAEVELSSFFNRHRTVLYEYDFGDSWLHKLALRGATDVPESFHRRLLDGGRAFPPEDCGGMWGYEECVRVVRGGEDPEDRREWLGDWDPDAFDLETTRRRFDR